MSMRSDSDVDGVVDLSILSLDDNRMRDVLAQMYQEKRTVQLTISGSSIDGELARVIAAFIHKDSTLLRLEVIENTSVQNILQHSYQSASPDGLVHLFTSVMFNTTLVELVLTHNLLHHHSGVVVRALCRALQINRSLRVLDLSDTGLNSSDASLIGEMLRRNHGLETLMLRRNKLDKNGYIGLARSLRYNSTLKVLDIGHAQYVGSLSTIQEEFLKTLQINTVMEEILFPKSPLKSRDKGLMKRIVALLRENKEKSRSDTKLLNMRNIRLSPEVLWKRVSSHPRWNDLEHLAITHARLEAVPIGILRLSNLQVLNLHSNRLTSLPMELHRLKALKILDLSINRLCFIEKEGDSLKDRESVLPRLPRGLLNLYLNNNAMHTLPHAIGQLPRMRKLDVSFNRISKVPKEAFDSLQHLSKLYMGHNRIQGLPPTIGKLSNLKYCWVENNRLDALPVELAQLHNLEVLDCSKNPLRALPHRFRDVNVRDLQGYFTALSRGCQSYKKIKVMLVGEGNVGKTSLLRCMAHLCTKDGEEKSIDEGEIPPVENPTAVSPRGEERGGRRNSNKKTPSKFFTGGVGASDPVATDGIDISKIEWEGVRLVAWDFAGQDLYQTTHQFFLSRRAVYLLVFNLLKAQEALPRLDYWLHSLHARVPDASIFILGSHLDQLAKKDKPWVDKVMEQLEDRYSERFPNVCAYIPISSKGRGKNVRALMNDIVREATAKSYIGYDVPTSWVQLSEYLEALEFGSDPPMMKLSAFASKAMTFNIAPKDLKAALSFLHETGDVAYFSDEDVSDASSKTHRHHPKETHRVTDGRANPSALSRLVFLDPQWLTDVMSSVVTLRHNVVRNGKLRHSDVAFIWSAPKFPPSIHPILLDLLRRFDILHPMANLHKSHSAADPSHSEAHEEVSIVPCLLDTSRPLVMASVWPVHLPIKMVQIGRVYHFHFLPMGFFSRLFVRVLHVCERVKDLSITCYWTNGIVLKLIDGDTSPTAFIEFIPQDFMLRGLVRYKRLLVTRKRGDASGPSRLLNIVISIVQGLIAGWYDTQLACVQVPCSHCYLSESLPPYLFDIEELELLVAKGKMFARCEADGVSVRVDQLAPDVAFAYLKEWLIKSEDVFMEEKIGEGGFATVYRGTIDGSQCHHSAYVRRLMDAEGRIDERIVVAVKKIHLEDQMDEELLEKFGELRREVAVMAGLTHTHVVGLVGVCLSPYLIVTEYMPMGSLSDYLMAVGNDIGWPLRMKIALDIALGMDFLHSCSPPVLHRDLKSPNVLLCSVDPTQHVVAKIADFGLSVQLTASESGREVWNPAWLAPEIIGGRSYDEKSDVYPYGIVLWELLTREMPFQEHKARLPFAHAMEDEIVHEGLRPSIPPLKDTAYTGYAELVRMCWAPSPSKRPSFNFVLRELLQLLQRFPPPIMDHIGKNNLSPYRNALRGDEHDGEEKSPMKGGEADVPQLEPTEISNLKHRVTAMCFVRGSIWVGDINGCVHVYSLTSKASCDPMHRITPPSPSPLISLCTMATYGGVVSTHVDEVWGACSFALIVYDSTRHVVKQSITMEGGAPHCMLSLDQHVWCNHPVKPIVEVRAKKNGRVVRTIDVGSGSHVHTIRSVGRKVWLGCTSLIVECSQDGKVVRHIPLSCGPIADIAHTPTDVWVASGERIHCLSMDGEPFKTICQHSHPIIGICGNGNALCTYSETEFVLWNRLTHRIVGRWSKENVGIALTHQSGCVWLAHGTRLMRVPHPSGSHTSTFEPLSLEERPLSGDRRSSSNTMSARLSSSQRHGIKRTRQARTGLHQSSRAPTSASWMDEDGQDAQTRPECPDGPACESIEPSHFIQFKHTLSRPTPTPKSYIRLVGPARTSTSNTRWKSAIVPSTRPVGARGIRPYSLGSSRILSPHPPIERNHVSSDETELASGCIQTPF